MTGLPRVALIGVTAIVGVVSQLSARTWFVASDAPAGGDGSTWTTALPRLDPALRAARAGDEIWVQAGHYPIDGPLRVPSNVALYGGFTGTEADPSARTAINFAHETALRPSRPGLGVVEIADAHDVRVDGFTLTGGEGRSGLVLRRCTDTVTITNCRIASNSAPLSGAGVQVVDGSTPRFFNVQIADNRATDGANGGGLFIDATSGGTYEYCIINGNVANGAFGGGALIATGSGVRRQFEQCDFYFNESGANGSALDAGGTLELRDCVLCSNLSRTVRPGLPVRVHGESTHLVLSGQSYVIGNLRDRSSPQYASGIDDGGRCELRDDAIVSLKESGPADLTLFTERNDVHTVLHDVLPPALGSGPPAPGRWVRQTLQTYAGTAAYHCLYLPADWKPGREYPVFVGFPGNGPFRNRFGDRSGGLPEDNPLGIGLSGGHGFIVLGLGYLDSRRHLAPTGNWWGDVEATLAYTQAAVRFVCDHYGGNSKRVVLYGFSRSAIGVSFIGLHDDNIAKLWRAFFCYDGWESQADMKRNWYRYPASSYNYDPGDFGGTGVERRFQRLDGRPLFILGGHGQAADLNAKFHFPVTLLPKPHRNHNVSWALRDTPERAKVRAWLAQALSIPAIPTETTP